MRGREGAPASNVRRPTENGIVGPRREAPGSRFAPSRRVNTVRRFLGPYDLHAFDALRLAAPQHASLSVTILRAVFDD